MGLQLLFLTDLEIKEMSEWISDKNELKASIADLKLENERIKKTSKKRFEKIKDLEKENKLLKTKSRRADNLLGFLNENGFKTSFYEGCERFDFTAIKAIKYLQDLNKAIKEPRVDGKYNIVMDGERFTCNVYHSICWMVDFNGEKSPLHQLGISELELIGRIE